MINDRIPDDMPQACQPFEVTAMLAALARFSPAGYANLADGIHRILRAGGSVLITAPSTAVDGILKWRLKLNLIHRRFRTGWNNLLVFRRACSQTQFSRI